MRTSGLQSKRPAHGGASDQYSSLSMIVSTRVILDGSAALHGASIVRSATMLSMVRTLELAISKAAELPEAAQEQLGREILERLDTLAELRAELDVGIRELDAGLGEPLDIEEVIAQARKEHAAG